VVRTQRAPVSRACMKGTLATGTRSSAVPCTITTFAVMRGSAAASASSSGLSAISSLLALRMARGSNARTGAQAPTCCIGWISSSAGSSDAASSTTAAMRCGSSAATRATTGPPSEWPSSTTGRPSVGSSARTAAACSASVVIAPGGPLRPKPGRSSASTSTPGGGFSR